MEVKAPCGCGGRLGGMGGDSFFLSFFFFLKILSLWGACVAISLPVKLCVIRLLGKVSSWNFDNLPIFLLDFLDIFPIIGVS